MAKFKMDYDDHELIEAIDALTPTQLRAMRTKYSIADIRHMMRDLQEDIARMLLIRLKAKISSTFTGGWGGRIDSRGPRKPLVESVYYKIDDDGNIVISSTSSVLDILNAGFASFDMKESALAGKTVGLRLPGGRVIYRKVQDMPQRRVDNLNPNLKTKKGKTRKFYSTKNWIHPGYQGKHLYEQVAKETEGQIKEMVADRVWQLLRTLEDNPYGHTGERTYYNYRRDGKFASFSPVSFIGSALDDE